MPSAVLPVELQRTIRLEMNAVIRVGYRVLSIGYYLHTRSIIEFYSALASQ
jgi:hypothetical protein